MVAPVKSNVLIATRFTHLAGNPDSAAALRANVTYEALTALAESLDQLALILSSFPEPANLDPRRAARLRERLAQLEAICGPDARASHSISIPDGSLIG